MSDSTSLVGLELADDFPAFADDADGSVVAADKEAVGACANAGYLIAFEQMAGIGIGEGDLGDFEEVE